MILVHATDRVFIELARRYRLPGLRVEGGESSAPLFFAPGIDANPMVPGSNPKDIAVGIRAGNADIRDRQDLALRTFVTDLVMAGRVPDPDLEEVFEMPLSGLVAYVVLEGASAALVPVQWRDRDSGTTDQVAILPPEDAVELRYRLLIDEHHEARDGRFTFRRAYDDGTITTHGDA